MPPLRILETACGVMGPFSGSLFADRDADVVKLEPPEGDWTRNPPGSTHAGLFHCINRGKRSVVIDVASREGRAQLQSLVAWADVVIAGSELVAAEITDDTLSSWNADVIRSWILPFGLSGPYANYQAESIQLLALGGMMHMTGDPGREPLQLPGYHPEYIAGIHAFTAASAALVARARFATGGQRVETSAYEAIAGSAEMAVTMYVATGAVRSRFQGRQPWGIQGEIVPCADGYVAVHPGAKGELLAILIGRPDLLEEPLLLEPQYRLKHIPEFVALLGPYLSSHTRAEVMHDCEELGLPFGAVLEIPDLLEDEQLEARKFFELTDIDGTEAFLPGRTYRTSNDVDQRPPAPSLGEHTEEVLAANSGTKRVEESM